MAARLCGAFGSKIGMTQFFDKDNDVVPVTVIDFSQWFVTQIKTVSKDGYAALQVGLLKKKYRQQPWLAEYISDKKKYFAHVKEISLEGETQVDAFTVGDEVGPKAFAFSEGDSVSASSASIGKGFQGVVKRWNFGGGPATHGSDFHRIPGSMGSLRRGGRIIKGKKLPGHMGARNITIKGLRVVHIDQATNCIFIKGAVPGKKDALVHVRLQHQKQKGQS